MDPEKPPRLFVNPFTMWTQLALKTGEAMWASAHAAALRKAKAPGRQTSKAARFKAKRAKLRSKANAKRRAKR